MLAQACSDGDVLDCTISFYRPSSKSGLEKFYEIVLTGALIRSVSTHMPMLSILNKMKCKRLY
ncbi:type VI secretion system tube protein Hcp [Aliivibrio fischeri]|uniref:type VI secretion system tube protein Hcp n=1 Tax=Aliivibrio fischeri TaxID=668 RepID=UPI003F7602BE